MKELEILKGKTELSVKKKKEIAYELVGNLFPYKGHQIWRINNETRECKVAEYSKVGYYLDGTAKFEIIKQNGFTYVSALNKTNALKNFDLGKSGGVQINENPRSLYDLYPQP